MPPEPIHLTDRQRAVHESLALHASHLGRMYLGALIALSDESNPDRYPQAAHSLRELMEKLPRIDLPVVERLEARVKKLEAKFTAISPVQQLEDAGEAKTPEELLSFLTDLDRFFREFHEERPSRFDQAIQVVRSLDPSNHLLPAAVERERALAWHRAHGYFEKLSHHNVSDLDASAEAFAKKLDDVESIVLALLRPRPAEDYEELDAAIREGEEGAVAPDLIVRITEVLRRGDAARYFFAHLSSPLWIPALAEAGLLEPPPPLRRDGGIAFPVSSATQYLVRVASQDPEAVVLAFSRMQTENCRVHEDCADAAMAMPVASAVHLVPKLEEWLGAPYQLLLLWKVGAVISYLANGGEASAALRLARRALSLDEADGSARRDNYDYQDVLKDNVPDLVRAAGADALELLCSLLDKAIRHEVTGAATPEDHSQYWRPSMDDRADDVSRELRYGLSGAVRDAALVLAGQKATPLSDILESLEKWGWFYFQRLAIHVLRLTEGAPAGLISGHLMNRELFETRQVRPEYQLLLRDHFGSLTAAGQERLLAWIAEGPKDAPEDEHAETRARFNLYSWLCVIEPYLDQNMRERCVQLRQEFGEQPLLGAFPSAIAFFGGPTSPYTADELLELPLAEVIERLTAWRPTGDWGEPSREGLARALAVAAERAPDAYSRRAGDFKILAKTYTRALVQGLQAAVRNGASISWPEAIELCLWLVFEAERDDGQAADPPEDDPGLLWTRREVAGLLQAGLGADLPDLTLRESIWSVLQALCGDLDPPAANSADTGLRWWDVAANSVRGVALLAAVFYGAWVKQRLLGSGEAWGGFESTPELRTLLEERVDPAEEQSIAVHSVFGRVVTMLAALDRGWLEANADNLFPQSKLERRRWQAAFDSYVVFCRPHEDLLDLMSPRYRRAIEAIGGAERAASPGGHMSPDHHLIVHLMAYYWHGALDLEPGGLVSNFFARAPVAYRKEALLFLGRGLHEEPESVDSVVLSRLQVLWDQRVSETQSAGERGELSAFGPWFASGLFDDAWSLDRLEEALRAADLVEGAKEVAERLALLASARPLQVLSCLDLLVKGDRQNYVIRVGKGQILEILERLLGSGPDSGVIAAIGQLANQLLAMGHEEFRALARRATPEAT